MVAASALYGVTALQATGDSIKEDVANVITNIAPSDTPFMSRMSKNSAKKDLHEWQRDTLDTPVDNNAHYEGEAFGTATPGDFTTAPFRLGNHCQISMKQINLTGRSLEGLDLHGRRSALAYQTAKKAPALKTDMESSILANQIAVPGVTGTTAGRSAGVPVWISTNDDFGAGGASGSLSNTTYGVPTGARTDGTDRPLSEATLFNQLRAAWTAGGKIDVIGANQAIVQRMDAYWFQGGTLSARIAQATQDFGPNPSGLTVAASVTIIKTAWGKHMIIPGRHVRTQDVLLLDMRRWKVSYLRNYRVKKMGTSGDFEQYMMLVDWCLESCDEEASAMVTDVQDAAMTN